MFVVSFANLKSRGHFATLLGDRVMPRAEVRIGVHSSHRNITVLTHLNL